MIHRRNQIVSVLVALGLSNSPVFSVDIAELHGEVVAVHILRSLDNGMQGEVVVEEVGAWVLEIRGDCMVGTPQLVCIPADALLDELDKQYLLSSDPSED